MRGCERERTPHLALVAAPATALMGNEVPSHVPTLLPAVARGYCEHSLRWGVFSKRVATLTNPSLSSN